METTNDPIQSVKEYYGEVLKTNKDLKTSACCTAESVPPAIRAILREVHPEVLDKFYGCGSPLPSALEGATVLDLGSGSGRDCFVLSKLVGPSGRVIGVDMTTAQIEVARRHVDYHTRKFGYARPNVEFHQGCIEDLESIGIASGSVDLVVSNCVVNLSPNKPRVLSEAFRALKPGGELYFSDVFADRRIPPALARDPVLLGECLGGALYPEDFRRLMARIGCQDTRVVTRSRIALNDPDIERKAGMITFHSMTIRAFKLELEDRCEDYGQVATYLGTLSEAPHTFVLDEHHVFKAGQPALVCGNTAAMLRQTRFAAHFRVLGDTSTHYGAFDCVRGPAPVAGPGGPAACC